MWHAMGKFFSYVVKGDVWFTCWHETIFTHRDKQTHSAHFFCFLHCVCLDSLGYFVMLFVQN
eukprot:NODE_3016_length_387_cov_105.908284_g2934_i0.p2 GENE.NODE_3016_length_387_cov_105.908284_g2934_i0~~NODE_3016_length_387_cov_105.908284_g2934_i0.p2  ORF type:complete len:62 (-),score=6.69 NODE_3016_length_387_cov_105.908284_g2934_i0:124-309(-)